MNRFVKEYYAHEEREEDLVKYGYMLENDKIQECSVFNYARYDNEFRNSEEESINDKVHDMETI